MEEKDKEHIKVGSADEKDVCVGEENRRIKEWKIRLRKTFKNSCGCDRA